MKQGLVHRTLSPVKGCEWADPVLLSTQLPSSEMHRKHRKTFRHDSTSDNSVRPPPKKEMIYYGKRRKRFNFERQTTI